MSQERKSKTVRTDRHLMPWLIAAVHSPAARDCVLVATMDGNEMLNVSLHVLDVEGDAKRDDQRGPSPQQ